MRALRPTTTEQVRHHEAIRQAAPTARTWRRHRSRIYSQSRFQLENLFIAAITICWQQHYHSNAFCTMQQQRSWDQESGHAYSVVQNKNNEPLKEVKNACSYSLNYPKPNEKAIIFKKMISVKWPLRAVALYPHLLGFVVFCVLEMANTPDFKFFGIVQSGGVREQTLGEV